MYQDTDHDKLKCQVVAIIRGLESPDEDVLNLDDEPYTAMDYVVEALDIEYVVSAGEYRGARLLVCYGGPTVWVDTRRGMVDGHWWGESYSRAFYDVLGVDEACRELYENELKQLRLHKGQCYERPI